MKGDEKMKLRLFFRAIVLLAAYCSLLTVAPAQDTPLTNKYPTSLNSNDSLGRTSDRATGALSANINSSVDTFTVTGDPASYPASGISVVIDNEIILCTTRSSAVFSGCLRGQKGTTAAAHLSAALVKGAILSSQRDVLVADLIELEKKLGFGSAPASGATTGHVLKKNGDGSTGWSAGVSSVTASSPLNSSGGLTPNITIDQADTDTSGYLDSTDWNTFNGKQDFDSDLAAIAALSTPGTGLLRKTAPSTYAFDTNVYLNQALADGKIYIGNGSGVGTAVTPSGDVTITNAGVTAIGALKVTNGMLAGSIAASKLVGTDIGTVGTITTGTWQATVVAPAYGGTGVSNTGTFTNASNTTITGGGTIALGGFTFTVPATGTGVLTSRTLTAGAGLSGGGDLSADRTFTVGAGNGITVNADDVALTTPGTLNVSTSNSSSGNHTHAITSSSNPGAAASLLATDASGYLTTVRHTVTDYFFVDNPTANIYLNDTSTGWQAAASRVITPQASNSVRSISFTSGLVGWSVNAAGDAEFGNVDVRGSIRSSVILFNAQLTTAGTQLITPSAGKLKNDVTVTASPTYGTTTFTIDIVDQDGITHAASQLFAVNDILRLKDGITGDTWFKVTAASDQTTFWRYTASIQAGTANVTYRAGLGVADYKQSGNGGIVLTADQTNAPYAQMFTHAGTFSSADASGTLNVTPQLRIGNLNGSYGFGANTFGFGTGQYGTASKSWVTVEQTNGIRIGNNTDTLFNVDTSGNVTVGKVAASLANTYISAGALAIRLNTTNLFSVDTSGNVTMGQVATSQGNAFWNNSNKKLEFRGGASGTVVQAYIDTDGAISAGGGAVKLNSSGLQILSGSGSGNTIDWFNSGTQIGSVFVLGDSSSASASLVSTGTLSQSGLRASYTGGSQSLDILALANSTNAYGQIFASSGTFAGLLIGGTAGAVPSAILEVRGAGLFTKQDTGTTNLLDMVTLYHTSSNTPGVGFGASLLFNAPSTTTTDQNAARIGAIWTTATHASRTSAFVIQTVNNAGSLAEVARFAGNGDATFTGVIKAGSGAISLTNATGNILGAALVGTDIATLGTVTTGTWSATTIAVNKGGTGQTSYTDGQLLIGNSTGNTLTKATLTGTSNQVVVTNAGGSITLSTPQSIGTGSSPTFAGLTVTSIAKFDSHGMQFVRGTGTLSNGQNDNVTLPSNVSYVTYTGPTGAYSVTGFNDTTDGRVLIVYFNIAQTLTIKHDSGTASGKRITIAGGADKTFAAGSPVRCVFVYDASVGGGVGYWVLFSASDGTTAGF